MCDSFNKHHDYLLNSIKTMISLNLEQLDSFSKPFLQGNRKVLDFCQFLRIS